MDGSHQLCEDKKKLSQVNHQEDLFYVSYQGYRLVIPEVKIRLFVDTCPS